MAASAGIDGGETRRMEPFAQTINAAKKYVVSRLELDSVPVAMRYEPRRWPSGLLAERAADGVPSRRLRA